RDPRHGAAGAAARADHALQRRHADSRLVLRRRFRRRRAALRRAARGGRAGVQPRQSAGDDHELRARQHDHPPDEFHIGDRAQAAPGARSGSARAVDREGDDAARLQADGLARERRLADDSMVRGTHGGPAQQMKLLVTGASGFIGRNVLLRAPRDWTITAVYRQTAGLPAVVREHDLSHVTAGAGGLLSAAGVASLGGPVGRRAALPPLAAGGGTAGSADRPRWDLESNTVALVNVLEHQPADRVVYVSSGAVYDGLRGPVTPATPVQPILPYAVAKLASERYVRFFAE